MQARIAVQPVTLSPPRRMCALLLSACLSVAGHCHADALVVTRAMNASTVAEFFVEEDSVEVELEIGLSEVGFFAELLPDELRRKLGSDGALSSPGDFFQSDGLVIRADAGEPLPGRVESLQARKRVVRDEITGEPLAQQPEDAELVVVASLAYPLEEQPRQIQIQCPRAEQPADIGFVAYHRGLPVNDFRYLASTATLELNWNDPWYSRFQNRNLRRQNSAPMAAYLYVEPFEVRKEIVVRPADLRRFMALDLDDAPVIPVSRQDALKQQIATFLADRSPVLIDGKAHHGSLDRIHFVRRSLRQTGIVDPPEDLDATSATLGVIFVYPIAELPQEVSMQWDLFDELVSSVPAATSDEAGPMPSTLTPEDPVLLWRNYLKKPSARKLKVIEPPPSKPTVSVSLVTLLCGVALLPLSLASLRQYRTRGSFLNTPALLFVALATLGFAATPYARVAIANPLAATPSVSEGEARTVIAGLLHNVYRAFDRRDSSLVYDQLALSIAGDLLEQVYLDTRKTIEIEKQGGLQINVKEVAILKLEASAGNASHGTFRVLWRVAGSVGHWGHVHERINEPSATITISAVDGSWKITAIEMGQR